MTIRWSGVARVCCLIGKVVVIGVLVNWVHGTAEECVALFRPYILQRIKFGHSTILDALTEDSVFGCWCNPGEACHCDVIAEVWESRRREHELNHVSPS
jgi:hypothetical protein